MTKLIGMLLAASGGIFPYMFDLGLEAMNFLPFSPHPKQAHKCLLSAGCIYGDLSTFSLKFHFSGLHSECTQPLSNILVSRVSA